eukprot:gene404-3750_t
MNEEISQTTRSECLNNQNCHCCHCSCCQGRSAAAPLIIGIAPGAGGCSAKHVGHVPCRPSWTDLSQRIFDLLQLLVYGDACVKLWSSYFAIAIANYRLPTAIDFATAGNLCELLPSVIKHNPDTHD